VLTLGIETSCDETAAAVYDAAAGRMLGSVVASQVRIHREYGGVVPELASREHAAVIDGVVEEALSEAGAGLSDVGAYAVTRGPGLVGALLVGLTFAKGLSLGMGGRPFVGVNHIEAHLLAVELEGGPVELPALGLVVSGGHTTLVLMDEPGSYRVLGRTRDDAAGEALDKAAKLLGLGYPGGPVIERLSRGVGEGAAAPRFPRARLKGNKLDFSFSGLKTALLYHVRDNGMGDVPALAAAFQEAVVDMIASTVAAAAEECPAVSLVAGGGVMCNGPLRAALGGVADRAGLRFHVPSPALCADNAAMIAYTGHVLLARRGPDDLSMDADPALGLGE